MDIRIGNDIRLGLTLRGLQDFDQANIKQLRCYLINTSLDEFCEKCDKGKCPIERRFPHEPFPQYYTPTPHTLHTCGKPEYHVYPHNSRRHYSDFGCGFHDYHWWPEYRGFGLRPGRFSADPGYVMPLLPNRHCDCCRKHNCGNPFEYLAPHKIAEGKNKIQVYFPAEEQYMCGSYKLVVVAVVYESGWGRTDLHTYTIDYGWVFNLVDDETGTSGDISIDVDINKPDNHQVTGIALNQEVLHVASNSITTLHGGDIDGHSYCIKVTLSDGTIKEYTPDNWFYDELQFISSNPNIVSIDDHGSIIAGEVEEETEVTVYVGNPDVPATRTHFTVVVKPATPGYIGFAVTEDASQLNLDKLPKVKSVFGVHELSNSVRGAYLWIVSEDPIADVDCDQFDIPLAEMQRRDKFYCYHCPNALIPISFDVTVR